MPQRTAFPIDGTIQQYAWGGYDFLRQLTGQSGTSDSPLSPWAELWLGAHPKGPARAAAGPLDALIEVDPSAMLGEEEAEKWSGQLPFLLKVLDVREMLSIQTHPDKAAAEAGYAREESEGLPVHASNRNYRDQNHKPELGVALTDFYLLHGFRSRSDIRRTLVAIPGWSSLLGLLDVEGVKGLYSHIMQADQAQINSWLEPLRTTLDTRGELQKTDPAYWARKAFGSYSKGADHDRGIFSIFWFNLVQLRAGQGIYQAAGIPHAYLEGVCVEIMANSDNVLRGGLTVKHIDVPELLQQLSFVAVVPEIISPVSAANGWQTYPTPAPDFQLSRITLSAGQELTDAIPSTAIYLLLSGAVSLDGKAVTQGRAIFKPGKQSLNVRATSPDTVLYRASAKYAAD